MKRNAGFGIKTSNPTTKNRGEINYPGIEIKIKPRCSDGFIDVSSYIIDDSRLTSTVGRTSTGIVNLDISILGFLASTAKKSKSELLINVFVKKQ